MTEKEFIAEFAEMFEISPAELQPETELAMIPMWDSVAYLSSMLLIDEKLGMAVRAEVFSQAVTFGDILAVVAPALQG